MVSSERKTTIEEKLAPAFARLDTFERFAFTNEVYRFGCGKRLRSVSNRSFAAVGLSLRDDGTDGLDDTVCSDLDWQLRVKVG